MIPLMMQEGYRPRGWLGLIIGSRLWHGFYPSLITSDEAFMQQMDALVREIGDRGKWGNSPAGPEEATTQRTRVQEGIPPQTQGMRAPTAAAAPAAAASTIATNHRAAPAPTAVLPQQQASVVPLGGGTLERLVDRLMERDEKMQAALEARLAELTPAPPQEVVSDEQLSTLLARVSRLHAAELLDSELVVVEDVVADFIELRATVPNRLVTHAMIYPPPTDSFAAVAKVKFASASTVHTLVELSEAMASDTSFARQVKRKVCTGSRAN